MRKIYKGQKIIMRKTMYLAFIVASFFVLGCRQQSKEEEKGHRVKRLLLAEIQSNDTVWVVDKKELVIAFEKAFKDTVSFNEVNLLGFTQNVVLRVNGETKSGGIRTAVGLREFGTELWLTEKAEINICWTMLGASCYPLLIEGLFIECRSDSVGSPCLSQTGTANEIYETLSSSSL